MDNFFKNSYVELNQHSKKSPAIAALGDSIYMLRKRTSNNDILFTKFTPNDPSNPLSGDWLHESIDTGSNTEQSPALIAYDVDGDGQERIADRMETGGHQPYLLGYCRSGNRQISKQKEIG